MRRFWIYLQAAYLCGILLATMALMTVLAGRWNKRWDFTPGKTYSLAEATQRALRQMEEPLEVVAFYPHDDPARNNFEVFLKQCRIAQPGLTYEFFDPDRVPQMAQTYKIREIYTVLLHYRGRQERIVQPTEQKVTNALIRLLAPRELQVCFVTGHKEALLTGEERDGYASFRRFLAGHNYETQEIILTRDKVPEGCQVVVAGGPHEDFDAEEFRILTDAFDAGKGIFFLIDPMDPGEGRDFVEFFKKFGIDLGTNVIVDKASRMVGGDFLVALVSQYMIHHPMTREFSQPTFFPVARSVQPLVDLPPGIDVVPLALSSGESWAETNLERLEKGQEADFESSYDILGPVPLAAAAERDAAIIPLAGGTRGGTSRPAGGRMVVVGDSDFLTNAYLDLSGNANFALNAIQWLSKDERLISLRPREDSFEPLLLSHRQRWMLLLMAVAGIPLLVLISGMVFLILRKRGA